MRLKGEEEVKHNFLGSVLGGKKEQKTRNVLTRPSVARGEVSGLLCRHFCMGLEGGGKSGEGPS